MNQENHAGKGDTPRKVDGDAYRRNHEAIFKKRESHQSYNDFVRAVADVCHRCADCDCMADPDHDSHDEMTYQEKR